jgi:hypothetical protein
MDKFFGEKEVIIQLECTKMAPTTVACFTQDKLQASKQANKQKRCTIN